MGNWRLRHMKSHDHHVMLQQIMLTGIWNLLWHGLCKTLIRLGIVFQCICTKVVNQNEINALRIFVVETLCMLEVWFPPTFFDLVTHLVIHLVDALEICESVAPHWCYPIERYLNVLKKYVRNKANPKGCIAFGYIYDEALGFWMEYFRWYPHTRH